MFRPLLSCLTLAAIAAFSAPDAGWAVDDFRNPEITSNNVPFAPKEAVTAQHYMVSAANPLAVQAGIEILKAGGSAIDAAIATQLALNVVEPQSSGIGGGGFMLYFDAKKKKLHIYDGRETAPHKADATLFLDGNGEPLPFMDAVQGGHSVGTPGLLKMLETAHGKYGALPWSQLFQPAMRLSGQGFPMSPRLHDLLTTTAHVKAFPQSLFPFRDAAGDIKAVGETVVNTPLHDTFVLLAEKGSEPFYRGAIARSIVDAVANSTINPGLLTLKDLRDYTVKEREPVCAPYRTYTVCSMPPPSSGGVTILQALGILERLDGLDIRATTPVSVEAAHLFAEASKMAYADRNRYLADPDFVDVPVREMLEDTYLKQRASQIVEDNALHNVKHGVFEQAPSRQAAYLLTTEEHPSTTHISVVDSQGNAVSMTTSIEQGFGSGLSAAGFLLNNQLTDFSFSPTLPDGTPHPNRVEAGKRPRSSMSPAMVFDKDGELVMVIGSPGGARIIEYVLQTLIGVLDWKLDVQQAINLPHYMNMNGLTELEANTAAAALKDGLEAKGHRVIVHDVPSGLHGITRGTLSAHAPLTGGADPRREGVAMGD